MATVHLQRINYYEILEITPHFHIENSILTHVLTLFDTEEPYSFLSLRI